MRFFNSLASLVENGARNMRILHTADWHLGQSLNGWSRDEEHAIFFENLRDLIAAEKIDALLV